VLQPGERAIIPTGIAVAIHVGLCGLVLPRSGLAIEHGVTCLNAPGLIDASYRGEVRVIMVNHGTQPFEAEAGDRIAQLLIVPGMDDDPVIVDHLPPGSDDRGTGGFGSSGRR
jgi:dUTP pyrophosphatase